VIAQGGPPKRGGRGGVIAQGGPPERGGRGGVIAQGGNRIAGTREGRGDPGRMNDDGHSESFN
jgi:hypothetical protein